MMDVMGIGIGSILIAAAATFVGVWAWGWLVRGRDPGEAAEVTAEHLRSVLLGIITTILAIAVMGMEVMFQFTELLLIGIGIGSIFAGVSWEVFGAVAFLSYLSGAAVTGEF